MEHPISMRSYVLPAIQKEIYDLFLKQKWCDANVKGFTRRGDKLNQGVQCHQLVLAMASPVIKHALQKATDGSKQMCCCEQRSDGCFVFDGRIILAGASDEVVRSLIPFIYGKSISENAELKNEITEWLNALQIQEYRHDRNMDSDDELLDDNHPLDETTKKCNGIDMSKNQCIACKKIFNSSQNDLYVKHLSAHKTAMLEQLKESKKNADGSKEFFCEMCQSRVAARKFGNHISNCFKQMNIKINHQRSTSYTLPKTSEIDVMELQLELPINYKDIVSSEVGSPQRSKETLFSCVRCKRRFKERFGLNKHSCLAIPTPWQYKFRNDSVSHVNDNTKQDKSMPSEPTQSNISKDRGISEKNHKNQMCKASISKNVSAPTNIMTPSLQPEEKPTGLFCLKCKETFPTKSVQKLHICKSPDEANATKSENIELFSSRSQRRIAQKVNPSSPKLVKKIKILKKINHDRTSKSCNENTNSSFLDSSGNISLLNSIRNGGKRSHNELENDDFQDFDVSEKSGVESNEYEGVKYFKSDSKSALSSPERLVIDLDVDSEETTRSPSKISKEELLQSKESPILEVVTDKIQDASVDDAIKGSKPFVESTPKNIGSLLKDQSVNCEQCGKLFPNQGELTDHILAEHDSDPFS